MAHLLAYRDFQVAASRPDLSDGEITALDQHGRSSFQLLQSYGTPKQIPLVYYAFDLLRLEKTDLRSTPLVDRRDAILSFDLAREFAGREYKHDSVRDYRWQGRGHVP